MNTLRISTHLFFNFFLVLSCVLVLPTTIQNKDFFFSLEKEFQQLNSQVTKPKLPIVVTKVEIKGHYSHLGNRSLKEISNSPARKIIPKQIKKKALAKKQSMVFMKLPAKIVEINNQELVTHHGFKLINKLSPNKNWVAHFKKHINGHGHKKLLAVAVVPDQPSPESTEAQSETSHSEDSGPINNTSIVERKENAPSEDTVSTQLAAVSSQPRTNTVQSDFLSSVVSEVQLQKDTLASAKKGSDKQPVKPEVEDDLVLIDLTTKKEPVTEVTKVIQPKTENPGLATTSVNSVPAAVAKAKLSKVVSQAIQRELGSQSDSGVNTQKLPSLTKSGGYPANPNIKKLDYSKFLASSFARNRKETLSQSSSLEIKAREFKFGEGLKDTLPGIIVRSHATHKKEWIDNSGQGSVHIESPLNNKSSLIGLTVLHHSKYLPTNVDLLISDQELTQEVPLVVIDEFEAFLDTHKIQGNGSFYFVELGSGVTDVDIVSSPYEKKLYLNETLEIVSDNNDAKFVLIAGALAGNNLVHYRLSSGEFGEKVLNLRDQEFHYEYAEIKRSSLKRFKLSELNVGGKSAAMMGLVGKDISYFNSEFTATKQGINSFSLNIPPRPETFRNYIEIKPNGGMFVVGFDSHSSLEIPGAEFVDTLMQKFDIGNLSGRCIVQLNLSKVPNNFEFFGSDGRGSLALEALYLDKDGKFYEDIAPTSKKVFLLGEGQGTLDIFLDYGNGKEDYLRSFCSEETYLVEHL